MFSSILHIACLLTTLSSSASEELFSAIAQMEPLIKLHERIKDDLEDYIMKENFRLSVLKRYLKIYKDEQENANEDISNYLGNPINAYTLIKRLTTDLSDIEDFIKLGKDYMNVTLRYSDVNYPTLVDMAGAAQAIMRLQYTYRLNVHEMAEGWINGVKHSDPMTAADCFGLSRALYKLKYYQFTVAWSMEALQKYKETTPPPLSFEETDIMQQISSSHHLMGDVITALEWTRKILELDPKHVWARDSEVIFKKYITNKDIIPSEQWEDDQDAEGQNPEEKEAYAAIIASYEALCRGEKEISRVIAKRLHCRYMTESHPFLHLAPFKVEQLYVDPDVLLFHDVLSDDEIETIKNTAKPRLKRASIRHHRSGELKSAAESRVGKSAGLDEESDVAKRVSRRVADMTGLSVLTAEELQVVNYGIGGHYTPHFDFTVKGHKHEFPNNKGNRIATVFFYISDVEQGGATVFTELGLSVAPLKGAALFWHNLLPSGEGDYDTRHAACPVLRGSKWVCTKWLHQAGQELLKPCNLKYQQEAVRYQRARDLSVT